MKIVADQQISHVTKAFSRFGDVTTVNGREISPELLKNAEILLVRSVTHVNAGLLENSQIKFVGSATSGIDHIDLDYLRDSEIGFAYAPGSNALPVAEYVLSSLFVLAEQQGFQLQDKTVGIIGCGEVGSRVLNFLNILSVKSVVNDPPLKDKTGDALYYDLEEIMQADIITVHVPLIHTGAYPTWRLINEKFLRQLKPDCILVNTSRGNVIDEKALKNHMRHHPDFLAVLDVWENEPDIDIDLLTRVAIGSPHIAGYSTDGKIRATEMLYRQACKYFNLPADWGSLGISVNVINPEFKIADDLSDNDAIQFTVLSHYDPRTDAAALRRLPEVSRESRGQYFDILRKKYHVRREFSATTIQIAATREDAIEKFSQLGFMVESL